MENFQEWYAQYALGTPAVFELGCEPEDAGATFVRRPGSGRRKTNMPRRSPYDASDCAVCQTQVVPANQAAVACAPPTPGGSPLLNAASAPAAQGTAALPALVFGESGSESGSGSGSANASGSGRPVTSRPKAKQEQGGPCGHCNATVSPQWRKGPKGKALLCNACGIRFLRTRSCSKAGAKDKDRSTAARRSRAAAAAQAAPAAAAPDAFDTAVADEAMLPDGLVGSEDGSEAATTIEFDTADAADATVAEAAQAAEAAAEAAAAAAVAGASAAALGASAFTPLGGAAPMSGLLPGGTHIIGGSAFALSGGLLPMAPAGSSGSGSGNGAVAGANAGLGVHLQQLMLGATGFPAFPMMLSQGLDGMNNPHLPFFQRRA